MNFEAINDYVKTFLQNNIENDDILVSWNEDLIQNEFKSLFSKSKKDKKDKKDKSAPKKPKTSYIFFCQKIRSEIKEENPEINTREIMREMGRRWKDLEDKSEFITLSEEDKVRYEEEIKNYVPSETSNFEKPKSEKKPKKTTTTEKPKKTTTTEKPKKPKTAYIIFCQEKRPEIKNENPEMSAKEITKELGRRWKELSEEEKLEFKQEEKVQEEKVQEEEVQEEKVQEEKVQEEKVQEEKVQEKFVPLSPKEKKIVIDFLEKECPELKNINNFSEEKKEEEEKVKKPSKRVTKKK